MALSELILKPLMKDPRPPESANRYPDGRIKYGMPSGHSMGTTAIMVWVILEVILRTDESGGLEIEDTINRKWLYIVLALCGPVPWSRAYNMDHTVAQVVVGAGFGIVLGIAAFLLRANQFPGHHYPWDTVMVAKEASSSSSTAPLAAASAAHAHVVHQMKVV